VRAVVVGAGAWGTAVAHLLRERGHDVYVARRDTLDDAPYSEADLVVLAVPSHAFREVLGRVGGDAPIPFTRRRVNGSRRSCTIARWRCSPGRTWRRRCSPASRARP
jgi:glycerol-3-phosphate dehydrogenase